MSIVKNELEKEIIITTATTSKRILSQENGGDAFALYHFYAYTATRQKTNNVKATDTFCMKGLGWGKTRFYRAKKTLQDLDLIESIARYIDGKIQGHYVLIKYLQGNFYSTDFKRVGFQESGKRETNTNKENINTNKENINACRQAEEVLEIFNRIQGREGSNKLTSTRSIEKNLTYWLEIYTIQDIENAVKASQSHHFWKDVLTPEKLFRKKNTNGEDVDRINELLTYRPSKKSGRVFVDLRGL